MGNFRCDDISYWLETAGRFDGWKFDVVAPLLSDLHLGLLWVNDPRKQTEGIMIWQGLGNVLLAIGTPENSSTSTRGTELEILMSALHHEFWFLNRSLGILKKLGTRERRKSEWHQREHALKLKILPLAPWPPSVPVLPALPASWLAVWSHKPLCLLASTCSLWYLAWTRCAVR